MIDEDRVVIVERTGDDGVVCTADLGLRHHSPTGLECGYAGSGPADLALNILEWRIRGLGLAGGRQVELWNKMHCSDLAYELHQKFKSLFIEGMPRSGGRIAVSEIDAFIKGQR